MEKIFLCVWFFILPAPPWRNLATRRGLLTKLEYNHQPTFIFTISVNYSHIAWCLNDFCYVIDWFFFLFFSYVFIFYIFDRKTSSTRINAICTPIHFNKIIFFIYFILTYFLIFFYNFTLKSECFFFRIDFFSLMIMLSLC